MARLVDVIEVISQSDQSWEQAAQRALEEASKTVRHIRTIYGQEFQADVNEGKITQFRLNARISFDLE
ncbi:MAG: dodecin domain-containing protein [Verrucomicrobia bacterium]|nr:dodecin domain-containing protein [Verrucomicrobiota bacterium]